MCGGGQDGSEFHARQSPEKARFKLIGKTENLVSNRQFADATHSILSIAYPQHSLGTPARPDVSHRIDSCPLSSGLISYLAHFADVHIPAQPGLSRSVSPSPKPTDSVEQKMSRPGRIGFRLGCLQSGKRESAGR